MTQVDRTTFKDSTATMYADNSTGNIGASDLRFQMNNIADSVTFKRTGKITDPNNNDDDVNTNGNGTFGIGDIWINESTNNAFVCTDNTTGNAVWIKMTFTDLSPISSAFGPLDGQLAVWDGNGADTLRGFANIFWDNDNGLLTIDGNLEITGTVGGRDIAVDGAKLDGLPADAINSVAFEADVVDGSGAAGFTATKLTVDVTSQDSGLTIVNDSGDARLSFKANVVVSDTADRALDTNDNFTHVNNAGAAGAVRWTLPTITNDEDLIVTFFKVEDQPMELIGSNTVTINGNTENGGGESLLTICPTPHNSFATILRTGVNTYRVFTSQDPEIQFSTQTGAAYTLTLTDRYKIITMNDPGANVLTIPDNTTVPLPVGTEIRVIQIGAGVTSITASAGVDLNSVTAGSGDIQKQWGEVRLYKTATDEWYVAGDVGLVA